MNEFFTQAQLHNDCIEIRYLISRLLNFNGLSKLIINKKHLNKKIHMLNVMNLNVYIVYYLNTSIKYW